MIYHNSDVNNPSADGTITRCATLSDMAHDPTRSLSVPEREAGDWHAADPASPSASEVASALKDEHEARVEEAVTDDEKSTRDEAVQAELDRAPAAIDKAAEKVLPEGASPDAAPEDVFGVPAPEVPPASTSEAYNTDPSTPEADFSEPREQADATDDDELV